MKTFIRLLAGAGAALGICTAGTGTVDTQVRVPEPTHCQVLSFPVQIADTDLVAESLSWYEGPYLEDGTYEEVCDVAALVVHNTSDEPMEQVSIQVESQQAQYAFQGSWIPAGGKCVLLDLERKKYAGQDVCGCTGTQRTGTQESTDWLEWRQGEDTELCMVNRSDAAVNSVRVGYKTWLQQGQVYMGGVTNELVVGPLEPGKEYTVSPAHYVRGYSKIVFVKTDE